MQLAVDTNSRLSERLWAWLFVCQFFGFPLASVLPAFAGIDSRPISVVYRIAICALTLFVVCRALQERWPLLKGPFAISAFILGLLLFARIVWDATFVDLPLNLPWSDEWSYLFGFTIIPLLGFAFVPRHSTFEIARKFGVLIAPATLLLVIAAAIYGLRNARSIGRFSTDFLNPISLAQMAISCFIVLNARAFSGLHAKRGALRRSGRWLVSFFCILATIASLSKGPIIALFAVIATAMLFRGQVGGAGGRAILTRLFFLVLSLSLVFGLLLLVDAYTPIQIVSRFTSSATDPSTSIRLELIEGALSQFEESPWLGSAFVEYESRFYPHNVIVEVMMTNGLPGLAALVALLFGCFYYAGRILWSFPNERWVALLFLQYFIESMFSGSLYFDATTWTTMLVLLGCAQAESQPAKRELTSSLVAT